MPVLEPTEEDIIAISHIEQRAMQHECTVNYQQSELHSSNSLYCCFSYHHPGSYPPSKFEP